MKLYRVEDIDLETSQTTSYDAAIFASGYESRATHLATALKGKLDCNTHVLGYTDYSDNHQRKMSDTFFSTHFSSEFHSEQRKSQQTIYSILDRVRNSSTSNLHLLVDYSSMSTSWYAALLSWCSNTSFDRDVTIDFFYSLAEYMPEHPRLELQSVAAIPGFEGMPYTLAMSTAIVGLGFDGWSATAVVEELEPEVLIAIYADPGAHDEYSQRARDANKAILEDADQVFPLPIRSVRIVFQAIAELISEFIHESDVSIVPLGPKPHRLGMLLAAQRFRDCTVLRIHGDEHGIDERKAAGAIIGTRVSYSGTP